MYRMTEEQIRDYEEFLEEQEKSRCTVQKYMRDIRKFYRTLSDDKQFEKKQVMQYKEMLKETYALSSVNSMLVALNGFLKYIGAEKACVKTCRQQRQIFLPEERELTKEEYFRLLNAAGSRHNQRLYHILQTICGTGIRISELPYITVEGVRKGRIIVNAKDKYRVICLNRALCEQLLKYCEQAGIQSGSIFITRHGNPVDRNNVWTDMKKLCAKAGVEKEKVYPHNLRHLFARTFYEQEKDVVRLADILGHSSVETTRIYTKISQSSLNREFLELGLIKNET